MKSSVSVEAPVSELRGSRWASHLDDFGRSIVLGNLGARVDSSVSDKVDARDCRGCCCIGPRFSCYSFRHGW